MNQILNEQLQKANDIVNYYKREKKSKLEQTHLNYLKELIVRAKCIDNDSKLGKDIDLAHYLISHISTTIAYLKTFRTKD